MGIFNVTIGSINHSTGGQADGYQNYSCAQQTQLSRGLTYPVNISTNPNGNENVRVWIDYNNDGQFDPVNELFFSSDNARQHVGTSRVIPLTAVSNQPLRMRVAADAAISPIPTPCSTPQYSQTEDYAVVLGTNTQRPVAAFTVNTSSACSGSFAFTDQSSRGPASWYWTFGDGATSTQQSPTHTYSTAGSYRVQLRACNANGCDSVAISSAVSWYPPLSVATACAPQTAGYCCGYGITQVSLAGQSHASADGSAGYEDFSCRRRFVVQQGQICPLQVTTGNALPHQVRVYIDYNNNGSFAEPGELVMESLSAVSPAARVGIAGGGITNTPLRMRVVADIVGQAVTSCSAPALGQIEDYSLVITPSPCTGLPAAMPRIDAPQICAGFPATLYYGSPAVAGASLQWQSSADSLTWTNLPLATTDVVVTPPVTATSLYYRVRAVCGSTMRFSPAFRPAPVPLLCYCRPPISNISTCADLSRLGRVWIPGTPLDVPPGDCTTWADDVGRVLSLAPASQTVALQRGGVYQLNAIVPANEDVLGWIDFNRNGLFEPNEYLAFTYTGTRNTQAQTTIRVPTTATLGLTGLRLRLRVLSSSPTFYLNHSCTVEGTGETLDLLVTITPPDCTAFALTGGRVQGPLTFCPGTVPPVSVQSPTPNALLQWQTSTDSLAWTDVAGATAAQLGGPAARYTDSLYVRVRVQCSGRTAYSPAVFLRPDPQLCFCTASSPYVSPTEEVGSIRLANTPLFSQTSPMAYGSYYWFYPPATPGNSATLLAGVSYPVVLQSTSSQVTVPYVMSWLDANNNGRLSAAEAAVLHYRPLPVSDSIATLTMPPATGAARQVRLRTQSLSEWENFTFDNQCSSHTTEIRDFLVTLAPATPSALPLTAGTIQGLTGTGVISNCPGQRVRLTAVGYSRGAALQWQQQVGSGGAWQPIAGATDEVLRSGVLTGPTSFRVEARLGTAQPVLSAAVLVSPTAPCPCQANLGNGFMNSSAGVIKAFALMGKGVHLLNRKQATLPVVNGSRYVDYSLLNDSLHAYLYQGQRYNYVIAALDNPTTASDAGLWADFNRNGIFEASEALGMQAYGGSFTVPTTVSPGPVRVRIRTRTSGGGAHMQASDACTSTFQPSETEDYTFTVAPAPAFTAPIITATGSLAVGGSVQLGTRTALPAGTVVTWEGPGGFTSTQVSPTLTNLTAARSGDYYLTARTASGDFQLTAARRLQIGQGLTTQAAQGPAADIALYPNPTTGLTVLHLAPGAPAFETLRVLSSTGQLLYTQPLTIQNRGTDLPLDLRNQPPGLYLVQLTGRSGINSHKLLLE